MSTEILEDYLLGDFHQDMDDIAQLEEALERTANVFVLAQRAGGVWPYSYRPSNAGDGDDKLSHGTQAMIAAAMCRIAGGGRLASGLPARLKLVTRTGIRASYRLGVDTLATQLKGTLRSGSFGTNDPVTLSHFADLLDAMPADDPARKGILAGISEAIVELGVVSSLDPRRAATATTDSEALLRFLPNIQSYQKNEIPSGQKKTGDSPKKGEVIQSGEAKPPQRLMNAFVPLRIARSVCALKKPANEAWGKDFKTNYFRFFESSLHEQLSYSDIPDSRFDPAELIFCLEGMILIAPNSVDDRLFGRVLDVLEAKQDESAHWRPSRPIYATDQGMTMLPVSVEGAVSLMRSIAIKDRNHDFQPFSARAVAMARRFWKWLQARAVRFEATFDNAVAISKDTQKAPAENGQAKKDERRVNGWHSEHVNDPGLVHLWDTSQVAEFMLAYRELLQRAIAGRTLKLSGLKINRPARGRPADCIATWEGVVAKFEPLPGADVKNQVYKKIGAAFVEPWARNDERKASSMMLYGPPGTGKSTVGENLADALGMRMITVTVSDFLGRGGAYVEARAKAIFQTLEAQFDSVILFDEIDAFLLDRDSSRYDKQDTLFQFLTPGMLTKINDLHKLGRSIFIIATNYKNRIDPAIQRKGRIDQHYLVSLPDKKRRVAILRDEMGLADSASDPSALSNSTVFFGYSDIKAVVEDVGGKGVEESNVAAELANKERRPATVGSYLSRIAVNDDGSLDWTDFPGDEFESLLRLWEDVHGNGTLSDMINNYRRFCPSVGDFDGKLKAQLAQVND